MNFVSRDAWCPSDGIQLDQDSLDVVRSHVSQAVQAGPGAGKTELLAQRAAFLLETNTCIAPKKILAISFKRDAARNLKERVAKRVGPELSERFDSYTFDAFAKGILDRFREGLPEWVQPSRNYEVSFPDWRIWKEFGDRPNLDAPFNHETFHPDTVKNGHAYLGRAPSPFPTNRPQPASAVEAMTLAWWTNQLSRTTQPLTFDMVKTLAQTIIHHNPPIKRAFLNSYSHVFLDEFQDTTLPQYAVLKEIFGGSQSILTAVGDNKQLIMTFAGATSERFRQFSTDFNSQNVALASNFRSNQRIVDIVNSMAKTIEPASITVKCSKAADPIPSVSDGIVTFSSDGDEHKGIAEFISREIESGDMNANDFIVLVRQKADDHENNGLGAAFEEVGLALRNEARTIGESGISLQDLSSEPLAQAVVLFIQVATGDRRYRAYPDLIQLMSISHGSTSERSAEQFRLEQVLRKATKAFEEFTTSSDGSFSWDALVDLITVQLGEDKLRRLAQEYKNPERFSKIKNGIAEFLAECSQGAKNWHEVVDRYQGINQVRLMTVHKSKGLEAHTIIFFSLCDESFFYKADMDEEALAFFVAVSRAEQRVFFTRGHGRTVKLEPLYDLLTQAGVPNILAFP
ncbi:MULTISPECIES: UvrD-helicase domain-containing protein [Pacificibacter]|uniref:UvrD-helicase domain-containing protein n=1 Tax=Pacificibacter TaxID=1042323 RepID=UPI001C08D181|nr:MULTISPECIES: ATP-dependent helicase [Pacificibacter]MBU2936486.1 ATP-dependent helicase [Pacificibacter marinus]MDO6614712.1 ATP-dependent helicase [Pacificibacter sp. 1_MG-2023]